MADTFSLYGPARWTPADKSRTWIIPITTNEGEFERRLVERPRPGTEGSPVDDTGSKARPFTLRSIWMNGHGIQGLLDPVYPGYYTDFLDALENKGKGASTLYVPGRGEFTVCFEKFHYVQAVERRDVEMLDLTFRETREDDRITAGSFTQPSAKGAGPVIARQLGIDGPTFGMGGDLFDRIEAAVNRLNAAINSPFDSAGDIEQRAQEVIGLIDRTKRNLVRGPQQFGPGAFSPLEPPEAVAVAVGLELLRDNASRQASAAYGDASVTSRVFAVPLSIFDVAALLGQNAGDLINLNAKRLPSLFAIPPGVPVLVKAA